MWGQAVKLVPDLKFLRDLSDDQYHQCLILTARYLERNNDAHGFAEAEKGVQLSVAKRQSVAMRAEKSFAINVFAKVLIKVGINAIAGQ